MCLPALDSRSPARGTMDQLGMVDVHVAAGTDGGASGDAGDLLAAAVGPHFMLVLVDCATTS